MHRAALQYRAGARSAAASPTWVLGAVSARHRWARSPGQDRTGQDRIAHSTRRSCDSG
ncbi:hypothetical protein BD289DRAFT_257709 [Coniella lustricola]|uniref:Uncharacterized protein n=1 Tax=Coniella lustricola TaxID=2025994 RepID=A0A2T3AKZ2_9PEZI|nr:hypothetical protein BD289DRAFT_257709 [Coniella lustricola]